MVDKTLHSKLKIDNTDPTTTLMCSRMAGSSCSTSGTRRTTFVTNRY